MPQCRAERLRVERPKATPVITARLRSFLPANLLVRLFWPSRKTAIFSHSDSRPANQLSPVLLPTKNSFGMAFCLRVRKFFVSSRDFNVSSKNVDIWSFLSIFEWTSLTIIFKLWNYVSHIHGYNFAMKEGESCFCQHLSSVGFVLIF